MFIEYLKAFLVGGALCAVGQLLINYTKLTPARILVGFVLAGVIMGALGIYDHLIEFAGGGATIPLTGFGNAIAKGTREAVLENRLMGIITGGLISTSAGITMSILCGLAVALIFKPKEKE